MLNNARGAGRLATLIWLVALGTVIYVGLKLIPMYMDKYRMEDEIINQTNFAQMYKDDELRQNLVKKAKELGLPLKAENFVIVRTDEKITISTEWEEDVNYIPGLLVRAYRFKISKEQSLLRK